MRMAWAGAMPRPLLAIFSISTVFSPGKEPFKPVMHSVEVPHTISRGVWGFRLLRRGFHCIMQHVCS